MSYYNRRPDISNGLAYDIETIPISDDELTDIQKEEINRKLEKSLERDPKLEETAERHKIMSLNPMFGKIICIGLGHKDGGKWHEHSIIGDEDHILKEFWRIISDFRGTFVSFNGISFDAPFINVRSMKHRIRISNKSFIDTKRYQIHPQFDLKQIVADWDKYKATNLRCLCDHLGVPSPKEEGIEASQVYQAYLDGRIDDIAAYCLRDVRSTYDNYEIVRDYK